MNQTIETIIYAVGITAMVGIAGFFVFVMLMEGDDNDYWS